MIEIDESGATMTVREYRFRQALKGAGYVALYGLAAYGLAHLVGLI